MPLTGFETTLSDTHTCALHCTAQELIFSSAAHYLLVGGRQAQQNYSQ
uniref:Uncharacterized protein n=1 Tax=Anguilla anguilla TaxID=7936 RepID=A0A0E9VDR8_ANGAN